MYSPEMAGKIVNACSVIHNMRIYYRLPIHQIEDYVEQEQIYENIENDEIIERRGPRSTAMRI